MRGRCVNRSRCGVCGRLTLPATFHQGIAIGPTCAKRQGLVAPKAKESASITYRKQKPQHPQPENLELFPDDC